MKITKHFVTVGKRRVHYLRAGSGPALSAGRNTADDPRSRARAIRRWIGGQR
jgi:hypothetical protein